MKSRCYCENVSCLPFVAFWCKEEKFSSSFGRWTAFDNPRPVTDRRQNARRCTLGRDSTAAEKWSTASTCVSSLACKCNKVDIRTQAHVRCSVHARPRPVQAVVLDREHVAQARNLSSVEAPMFGLLAAAPFKCMAPVPSLWQKSPDMP